LLPSPASAHFKITTPASWMSQDAEGGPQKNGPCAATPNIALGDPQGTPTNMVTVEQAGGMIPITVMVTIAHPGWFRVALAEGPSSTQTLTTIPDPQAQKGTNCTPAIMANPVWSPTQPIIADGLPAGSTPTTEQVVGVHTFQVPIPAAATCTSAKPCTLQVIMMMTDHPVSDCYYHHCADISFGSASDGGGSSTPEDASLESPDSSGAASSGGSSSVSTSGAGSSSESNASSTGSVSESSSSSEAQSSSGSGANTSGVAITAPGSTGGNTSAASSNSGGNAGGAPTGNSGGGCAMALSSAGGAPWAAGAMALFAFAGLRRRRRQP
jgi:MYXO-CTERM domain-containing protein